MTVAVLATGVVVVALRSDSRDATLNVRGGKAAEPIRRIGGVEGVSVAAEPRDGLHDGDLVEVRVTGLAALPGAVVLQCAGDVTAGDASEACDQSAVEIQGPDVGGPAIEHQVVSVARTIRIRRGSDDPNVARPYDCATETAGCVLAVGPYALPVRAVLVPITFENIPMREAVASMRPAGAIQDGEQVTVTVDGLRPNASFYLLQCKDGGTSCTAVWEPSVRSDASGRVTLTGRVSAALYAESGRTDCVVEQCTVVVAPASMNLEQLVGLPIRFAPDVVAAIPQLSIEPPGPYEDQQVVTLHGQGFPKGRDITNRIGQCPADKDTAVEERCGYDLANRTLVVDDRGEFTATLRVFESVSESCVKGPGCVLGWVLQHGPIAAQVPLEFRKA